jgi:hypothetical protein
LDRSWREERWSGLAEGIDEHALDDWRRGLSTKAVGSTVALGLLTCTHLRLGQYAKAYLPMEVTVAGRETVVRLAAEDAKSEGMLVTEVGMLTVASLVVTISTLPAI